jgi:hypothetical protein
VEVPGGILTFFRFTDEDECGSGYTFRIHGVENLGGLTSHPCGNQDSLDWSVEAGALPFAVIHGEVQNPHITSIKISVRGREEALEAVIVNGFWYVFLPGEGLPVVEKVAAYDQGGTMLLQKP